jgi:hypothetical protein
MKNRIIHFLLCAVGLLGLYFKVEYSGWVVFVGLLGLVWT